MEYRFIDDVQENISKSASVASDDENLKLKVLEPCLIRDIRAACVEGRPAREVEELIRSLIVKELNSLALINSFVASAAERVASEQTSDKSRISLRYGQPAIYLTHDNLLKSRKERDDKKKAEEVLKLERKKASDDKNIAAGGTSHANNNVQVRDDPSSVIFTTSPPCKPIVTNPGYISSPLVQPTPSRSAIQFVANTADNSSLIGNCIFPLPAHPSYTISGSNMTGNKIQPVNPSHPIVSSSLPTSNQVSRNVDERYCVDALLSLTQVGADDEVENWVVDNDLGSDEEIVFEDSVGDQAVLDDPSFQ